MNIEHLTREQLVELFVMLEDNYDHSDVTNWIRLLMNEVNAEMAKRVLAGTSKPRAKVVNRIPMLTMREPLKKHGATYYDVRSFKVVHASYHRGVRYTHDGQWSDCLECGPNAW